MDKVFSAKLRCITCAGEDFEFNEDKSYVKCNTCGREYLGGYDELLEYNQDVKDAAFFHAKKYAEDLVKSKFNKAFKNMKDIKIR